MSQRLSTAIRQAEDWADQWSDEIATARKYLRRTAVVAAVIPVATGMGLMIGEKIRRMRFPLNKEFPISHPVDNTVGENTTTIYSYGRDVYGAMLDAIESAEHRILFETFIWKSDSVGERFKNALNAAVARGVEVFVIYDSFANTVVPRRFFTFDPRVEVLCFPWIRPSHALAPIRSSGRDHRKILVVDNKVGFVGGYNIGSLYANSWRDTHLRIVGPAVWELTNAFTDFWNRWRTAEAAILPDVGTKEWLPQLQAARNSPADLVFPIRNVYLDAIDRAVDHIYISTAYFIPDHNIRDALLKAAKRGVDVRVIMPERSNHVLADWLARGHYHLLLSGGVRIFLFTGAMIHAKTATVDGRWATIGTANIDRLSLTGNYEINMDIVDPGVARSLEAIFNRDLSNCRELTEEEWAKRSPLKKLGERAVWPLTPFL